MDLARYDQGDHPMSSPGDFSNEQRATVAEEIAELFGALGYARPGQSLVIGAPIQVWVAFLIDGDEAPPVLTDTARWTERFHHQVLDAAGPPLGYARTRILAGEVVVCEFSDASDFAAAIERGLGNLRSRFPDAEAVHLLSVPELQVDALWLLSPEAGDELVIVRAPEESLVEPLHRLTGYDLVQMLMTRGPLAGMTVGLDEILRDRSLIDTISDDSWHDALPRVAEAIYRVEERHS